MHRTLGGSHMTYTRDQYRADLNHKLLALEDGGYGDFAYDDTDLNLFLDLSVSRLYPAVYRKVSQGLALTSYGTQNYMSCTPLRADRVFRIEDLTERTAILGWTVSGGDIINIDPYQGVGSTLANVTVYYHDAYVFPIDDDTDVGLEPMYKPLVVLGALIEALESRQDTGVRGDPPPTGNYTETQLLDRLIPRYDKMVKELAMSLPAVML